MTTKVLALTEALGNLVRFKLLPGQRSEIVGVPDLIDGLTFDALVHARGPVGAEQLTSFKYLVEGDGTIRP